MNPLLKATPVTISTRELTLKKERDPLDCVLLGPRRAPDVTTSQARIERLSELEITSIPTMADQIPPTGVAASERGRRSLTAAGVTFLLAGVVAFGVVRQSEQHRLQEQRTSLSDLAGKYADAIQISTQRALSATYALAALVHQGQGQIANFDAIASELIKYYPGADSLQLGPGGITQQIVPRAGNEQGIGRNLLQDPLRNKEAFRARTTGQLTLAGPFPLIQGGVGIVGRLPVFMDQNEGKSTFWGFATVLIRYPKALEEARLPQLKQQGYDYELWRIHPDSGHKQTIATSSATELVDPVTRTLNMSNGNWTLSVAPIKGWSDPLWLTFKSALGLLFSLLLGYLAKLLYESREQKMGLQALVLQRSAEINATQAKLQAIFDAIPDLVWLKDTQGVFLDCNPMFERLFGTPKASILGKTDDDFMDAEQAASFRERDRLATATTQPSVNEEWLTFASDGRRGLFETTKTPMFDDAGQLVGVLGIAHDISERKRTEEALRESTQKLRIAAEAADLYDWEWDVPTDTLTWGRDPVHLLGPPDELTHKYPDFRDLVHPEDRERYLAAGQRAMRTGNPYLVEFRILERSGAVRWIAAHGKCEFDSANRPARMLGVSQDITERKQAQEDIQQLAFTDALTGLPNRRLLIDRLKHALAICARSQREGALLFIDLDNFKTLNDTLGHDVGDLLLQQVAQRLLLCVRAGDTVSRLGGDEFVVLLQDLHANAQQAAVQVEVVVEKLLSSLSEAYLLGGDVHHSSASIGVALFGLQHESVDELLKRADLAMYSAKAAGRNTLRFFDPSMQTVITSRAALEADLREAVRQEQFVLHYQAQVAIQPALGDCVATGAEVLVRWLHPERGMVSPAEFIPVAEEIGLILPLGQWVLTTACVQLALWAADPEMAHLTLAVNVSARQIHHRDFVAQVLTTLEYTGANPRRLKLELTESMLVMNVEDVIAKMNALKAVGVGFAIDDFGTGYSSLSYLKRLPLDQLKIDQSFVRDILIDPNDASIARMVVVLARSLGLTVIAEGVETEEQRDALVGLGCHAYQGYFFSRPLPLTEFEAFVQHI